MLHDSDDICTIPHPPRTVRRLSRIHAPSQTLAALPTSHTPGNAGPRKTLQSKDATFGDNRSASPPHGMVSSRSAPSIGKRRMGLGLDVHRAL